MDFSISYILVKPFKAGATPGIFFNLHLLGAETLCEVERDTKAWICREVGAPDWLFKDHSLSHLYFRCPQACHFSPPTPPLLCQMGHTVQSPLALIVWCSSVSLIANICLKCICSSLIKLNQGESITFRQLTNLPFLRTLSDKVGKYNASDVIFLLGKLFLIAV